MARKQTAIRARGLSLIEVVASIALMGVLLVGIVTARAKHLHQVTVAERKLAAIDAADTLIASWFATPVSEEQPSHVPRDGEGAVAEVDGMWWKTRMVDALGTTDDRERLEIDVVRLTITDTHAQTGEYIPILAVDLVVPRPALAPEANEATP